jgi:hypothetical protein
MLFLLNLNTREFGSFNTKNISVRTSSTTGPYFTKEKEAVGLDNIKLDPFYIAGLSDGEATFTISIIKDKRERSTARRVKLIEGVAVRRGDIYNFHPSFSISLNIKDIELVYLLQSFFGVGNIKRDLSNNAITYYVNSVVDLNSVIIPFFDKYRLISQKQADFSLFKSAIKIISQGQHLTDEGLAKIISIKASMGKGLSEKLLTNFPDLVTVDRPKVLNQEISHNF